MSNIRNFLTAMLAPAQLLEDTMLALIDQRNVDNAVGAQLTQLGNLVGQRRQGVTDDDLYRRYVKARIITNRSDGQPETIYRVARVVIGETVHTLWVLNEGAAAFVLIVDDLALDWTIAEIVMLFLRRGTSAGVRPLLVFFLADPDEAFSFAASDDYEASEFGFADTSQRLDVAAEVPALETDADPWDAILASLPGAPTSLKIETVADAGLSLEVRDGERWDGVAWVVDAETVGITIGTDGSTDLGALETAIASDSAWIEVTTPTSNSGGKIVTTQSILKPFIDVGGHLASVLE